MKFNIQSWWKKENSQKNSNRRSHPQLDSNLQKTHSWHCPWWWEAKCFLPETRNKVRISTYIILIQHWAGNASFTSMTESSLHPALVGSNLGSLSTLFIWRGILDDCFLHIPYPIQQQNLFALPSKICFKTQPSPLPVQSHYYFLLDQSNGSPRVVLLHLYP